MLNTLKIDYRIQKYSEYYEEWIVNDNTDGDGERMGGTPYKTLSIERFANSEEEGLVLLTQWREARPEKQFRLARYYEGYEVMKEIVE